MSRSGTNSGRRRWAILGAALMMLAVHAAWRWQDDSSACREKVRECKHPETIRFENRVAPAHGTRAVRPATHRPDRDCRSCDGTPV